MVMGITIGSVVGAVTGNLGFWIAMGAGIGIVIGAVLANRPAEDKPGRFGEICRKMANAGINIDLSYLATNTRLVLGTNDIEKARSLI